MRKFREGREVDGKIGRERRSGEKKEGLKRNGREEKVKGLGDICLRSLGFFLTNRAGDLSSWRTCGELWRCILCNHFPYICFIWYAMLLNSLDSIYIFIYYAIWFSSFASSSTSSPSCSWLSLSASCSSNVPPFL